MDEWTDGREDIQNVHIVKLLKHTNQQTERQTDGSEKQKFLLWLPCLLYQCVIVVVVIVNTYTLTTQTNI